jgi:hypothetical protein
MGFGKKKTHSALKHQKLETLALDLAPSCVKKD